jgi:hypothetical protein
MLLCRNTSHAPAAVIHKSQKICDQEVLLSVFQKPDYAHSVLFLGHVTRKSSTEAKVKDSKCEDKLAVVVTVWCIHNHSDSRVVSRSSCKALSKFVASHSDLTII